jgi:hypothetical protein
VGGGGGYLLSVCGLKLAADPNEAEIRQPLIGEEGDEDPDRRTRTDRHTAGIHAVAVAEARELDHAGVERSGGVFHQLLGEASNRGTDHEMVRVRGAVALAEAAEDVPLREGSPRYAAVVAGGNVAGKPEQRDALGCGDLGGDRDFGDPAPGEGHQDNGYHGDPEPISRDEGARAVCAVVVQPDDECGHGYQGSPPAVPARQRKVLDWNPWVSGARGWTTGIATTAIRQSQGAHPGPAPC